MILRNRLISLLLVLVAPALLAACGQVGEPTADQIVEQLTQSIQNPPPVHMTVEMTMDSPMTGRSTTIIEQWSDGPDRSRAEYRTAPGDGDTEGQVPATEGTVIVNGDQMWMYQPTDNTYFETDVPEAEEGATPDQLATMTRQVVKQVLDAMTFSFQGTEEIAGRTAYIVQATAAVEGEPATLFGSMNVSDMTLWLDSETWQVLKLDTTLSPDLSEMQLGGQSPSDLGLDGDSLTMQLFMETTEIEYDPDFPDGTFAFDPPEGATKLEVGQPPAPGGGQAPPPAEE